MSKPRRVMSNWQLMSFGLLTTPLAMAGFALVIYLPTYYAVEVGLGLSTVGAIFLFGRLLDVVTDPLVGHFSDRTRHRFGPRLPWMVVGVPGLAIALWFLLVPSEGAGLFYLLASSAAFFLFYTVLDVPYASIGLEISPDTHERTLLAGSKAVFQVIGALLASIIPIVLAAQMGASLRAIALVAIALLAIGVVAFLLFVPRSVRPTPLTRSDPFSGWRTLWSDRRFRDLIIAFFVVQCANALTAGLGVLYVTHVIGAPQLAGVFFLVVFGSTVIFLPAWIFLSRRTTKKTTWIISILICAAALIFASTLEQGQTAPLFLVAFVLGGAFGCDAIMPTSMLADLVYEGEAAGRERRGATSVAIKNAASKMTFVLPMGLAFPLLDLVGFDEVGANGSEALRMLVFFYALLPALLRVGLAFYLARIRFDRPAPQDALTE